MRLKNRLWNPIFPSQKSHQDLCWWFSILGCIEVMIMHPLDLIKTRFQLQNNNMQGQQQYSGVRDCARKMYQQEGLFSFWKGLLPPILVETPKRAWKFFTFEQFQKVFLFGREKPGALVGKYSNFKKISFVLFTLLKSIVLWMIMSSSPYYRRIHWQDLDLVSPKQLLLTHLRWSKSRCSPIDLINLKLRQLGKKALEFQKILDRLLFHTDIG